MKENALSILLSIVLLFSTVGCSSHKMIQVLRGGEEGTNTHKFSEDMESLAEMEPSFSLLFRKL
ncbi:hypothetical protein ACFFIX_24375 [Metabacillus herbersteinensis]|uniref:Lipoprotein n=1 Tax=Metabacillus herbersteinensis TaxID=283816 RepID=A0ABV6GLA4_9BACI